MPVGRLRRLFSWALSGPTPAVRGWRWWALTLRKLNGPIIVPLLKEAGVRVEYREYPGYGHGFYFGGGADLWAKGANEKVVADVVRDVLAFLVAGSGQQTAKPDKK
jgi:acetyl esterase/lipase